MLLKMSLAAVVTTLVTLSALNPLGAVQPEVNQMSKESVNPTIILTTTSGDITLELYPDKAPVTVANFIRYAKEGHYENTIFHRVIDGFMIQGGGFTKEFEQKPVHEAIANEAGNGLLNKRGTVAMARTSDINSATAQFFINVVDSSFLDHKDNTSRGFGYCVFGKVISGMDVVDKIKGVDTGSKAPYQDVPVKAIEILKVSVEANART